MKRGSVITLLLLTITFLNFITDPDGGGNPFRQPAGFPPISYDTGSNAFSGAKYELGRKLFYDSLLSRTNHISCASCHKQEFAFSDAGNKVSTGVEQKPGSRNTPSLANLAWNKYFFWDGSVESLDLQPVIPITNHIEMDETVQGLLVKLNSNPEYKKRFSDAFGTEKITFNQVSQVLSQFLISCVSAGSKYDAVVIHKTGKFTKEENGGYRLFKQHCAVCHAEPLFTNQSFANNGIGPSLSNDEGRFLVTKRAEDKYFFKVPGLRNISLTAPYMHDGRFATLEEVLQHYQANSNRLLKLNPLLTGFSVSDSLTQQDEIKLIAFLKTLTDSSFVHNPDLNNSTACQDNSNYVLPTNDVIYYSNLSGSRNNIVNFYKRDW